MKRVVKAALILMTILTVIYVSVVVYANTNSNANFHDSHRYVVYAAYKYEQDTLPTEWYTLEELGIVEVWERGTRAVQIVVDREKEPFPFGPYGTDDQQTIFLYKDEFYVVSHRWVTLLESIKQWQVPIGGVLGAGWVCTGMLFLKWRKRE